MGLELVDNVIADLALNELSLEDIINSWDLLTDEEKSEIESNINASPPQSLLPHQVVPTSETWWEVFLLIGGRGTGKTKCGAQATRDHLRELGPKARIGIGAPTSTDVRDTCMEGETGLIKMFPHEFIYYNRSLGEAKHIGGGIVKARSTEKPERWNGPQWSMIWFDELALCNQAAWDDANLGLRLGPRPYAVCTTTPKNRKWVKDLAQEPTTYVPQYIDAKTGKLRIPTTFDNPFLPERRVKWLKRKYGGTRIGRQELLGQFIDDVAGSLWKREFINHVTDNSRWPRFVRIIVAVDPAGSRSRAVADKNSLSEDDRQNQRKNADTAIAVMGLGADGNYYLLSIRSGQWTPEQWGREVLNAYHRFRADKIVAEKNFGGDMVESNIRNIRYYDETLKKNINGKNVPIKLVTASRGKDVRAEPIATLYEQGRVFHCAYFGEAEDQMCSFVDADDNEGADMVDAIVWAGTELAHLDLSSSDTSFIVLPGDDRIRRFNVQASLY